MDAEIPEFRSLGFFEKSRLRLSRQGRGASAEEEEEEIAALRIQRREELAKSVPSICPSILQQGFKDLQLRKEGGVRGGGGSSRSK
jgi:hypothetical protein